HLAKKVECAACHKGIETSTAVTPELFVDMDACVKCHTEKKAKTDCSTCHKESAKTVALGKGQFWAPANHDPAWRAAHGAVVRLNAPKNREERCDTCHGQAGFPDDASCAPCHASTKPADHEHLWKLRHGQTVRRDPDKVTGRCAFCH